MRHFWALASSGTRKGDEWSQKGTIAGVAVESLGLPRNAHMQILAASNDEQVLQRGIAMPGSHINEMTRLCLLPFHFWQVSRESNPTWRHGRRETGNAWQGE